MTSRSETLLWVAQRASAGVLAICVAVHLVTMTYAIRTLSATEILGRTKGNVAWFCFYMLFVLAVTVHVPIGLRAVLAEWVHWRGRSRDVTLCLFAHLLFVLGMRAALGVFL